MTASIDWSDNYLMFQIDMYQASDRITVFVPYHDIRQIRILFQRLGIATVNFSAFVSEQHKIYVRHELTRKD